MKTNRQGIIVWFQHMKNLKQIKRYGNLIYASKRLKYAVIYANQSDLESIENKLNRLPFVSRVEKSYKPYIRTDFENAVPDKAKQYDYKMGI
ncbi:YlbG family protein [Oceanobacillus bengalensis]|uniref:UPF0298 protein D8M05_07550 n=1 Tax=Oceanobacillus bengalensis TaxID=1435466 RepID=A0A494Z1C2_9BACI|nr:DUF2129 domain-containing protein [Oceanobacillus bengalensis]RKQ16326.1 DUF2129 domain-containing protein [Oceanobacillus bengalensis]